MFLSGLDNVDMRGLFGLGADMNRNDLFSLFRSALKDGLVYSVTDAEINDILGKVLSKYEVRKVTVTPDVASNVDSDVRGIVIGALGIDKAGAYASEISSVASGLKSNGLSLAPIGYTPSAVVSSGSPSQPQSSPRDSIAYQGAIASQQGRQQSTQSVYQSTATIQSAPVQIVRSPRTGLPVIYRRQAHRQTPADRQRLFWIIGGFGVVFALAIGVIAARSGD